MRPLLLLLTIAIIPHFARAAAGGLPFDPSSFEDPSSLIGSSLVNSLVKTVGFALDHRPYEGATPLGTFVGLDMGIEITLAKLPSDLATELAKANPSGGTPTLPPFLPVPRLHLHKGIGQHVSIGLSGILYKGFVLYGGDLKITLYNPSEGITLATRMSYSVSKIGFVSTKTYTPQLLISRRVSFADPYIGVGYQYATGGISFPLEVQGISLGTLSASGSARGFIAFMGTQFRVAVTGLELTLEGSYSSVGVNTFGTKFGFSF